MSVMFLTAYYNIILMLVVGAALSIFTIHAVGAVGNGLSRQHVPRLLLGFTLILGIWFAIVTTFANMGIMGQGAFPGSPPLIGLFFIGGSIFWYLIGLGVTRARLVIDRIDQSYFMGIQSFRMLGIIFVIGGFTGQIPWIFALPAGLGDMWAGYMGYRAMKAVNANDPMATRKVKEANWVGLIDFGVALLTGLITSETIYKITGPESTNLIGEFPLVLVPGFLVPIFAAAHLFSIRALRRKSNENLHMKAA